MVLDLGEGVGVRGGGPHCYPPWKGLCNQWQDLGIKKITLLRKTRTYLNIWKT